MTNRIAIFDLDRTITTFGTFTPFLLSTQKSPLDRAALLGGFIPHLAAYGVGSSDRKMLKDRMMANTLSSFSRAEIAAYSQAFVERTMISGLRPGAVEAIKKHNGAGDKLVMATASVDFYASIFAERLGFDLCIATRTTFNDPSSDANGEAPRIVGANCYGRSKLDMVLAILEETTGAPRDQQHWTFYSDHHSDFVLLHEADTPVVVTPKLKTKTKAARENLPVVVW